jgi:dTDP-glucose 4,6-dehydratase
VREILGIVGKPDSLIEHVKDRPGHDRRYAIDASRAKVELGWAPEVDLASGLKATVEWYLANRGWCEAVVRPGARP